MRVKQHMRAALAILHTTLTAACFNPVPVSCGTGISIPADMRPDDAPTALDAAQLMDPACWQLTGRK